MEVTGLVVESQGSGQAFELQATEVKVVGWVEDPDTLPHVRQAPQHRIPSEQGHLRARTNIVGAVTRVRNCLSQAIHRFFHEQGYLWIAAPSSPPPTPKGPARCSASPPWIWKPAAHPEGKVDYDKDFFGKETFLTVSGQLNVETRKRFRLRPVQGLHLRGRPSAPKTPTPAATWPSSGWWSWKWPSPTWNENAALAEAMPVSSSTPCWRSAGTIWSVLRQHVGTRTPSALERLRRLRLRPD